MSTADTTRIFVDYPLRTVPRYGWDRPAHPGLEAVLSARSARYAEHLCAFLKYAEPVSRMEPGYWRNPFIAPPDAVSVYTMLRELNPARYIEIGSGYSTRMVRMAVSDGRLKTRITSVDPQPRAEIDALCDRVIRSPAEDVPITVFSELQAGDVLFIDGSHRVLQNSDVTAMLLDVLPLLSSGVWIHFHDIFLPWDYPMAWAERLYSEQYLLAAYLLGGNRFTPELPMFYVSLRHELQGILKPLWSSLPEGVQQGGCSFWLTVA